VTGLNAKKYLFVFAHPDDEVFIAGTMKQLLVRGAELHGAWLTSGDYFGKGQERERELSQALNILGLPGRWRHLFRLTDLGLLRELDRAADKVAKLVREIQPEVVFANAFEGGHPDHDAMNFLAYEGCSRAGIRPQIFEFPLYNGAGQPYYWWWQINHFPPGGAPTLYNRLADDAVDCKYSMMRAYSGQWMYMIPARLVSSYSKLRRLGEPYRRCPENRDHTLPPHPGTLNYERPFNSFMKIRFSDFREAVAKVRQSKPRR
jgi:LmbE family N-acetylglucosaminyl deacetylase